MNFIIEILQKEYTINLMIGALGGGLINILIFCIRRLLTKKRTLIATYNCVTDQNQGQKGESVGQLMHHLGEKKGDDWKYTESPVGNKPATESTSMIYGPYTSDMDVPGLYEIKFIFRGDCPKNLHSKPLFQIDCTNTILRDGESGAEVSIQGINYILGEDIKEETSSKSVVIRSEETKIREYRIIPINGKHGGGERPNNLTNEVEAIFIKVEIWKINEIPTLMGDKLIMPSKD